MSVRSGTSLQQFCELFEGDQRHDVHILPGYIGEGTDGPRKTVFGQDARIQQRGRDGDKKQGVANAISGNFVNLLFRF